MEDNVTIHVKNAEYSVANDRKYVFLVPINRLSEPEKTFLRSGGSHGFKFAGKTNQWILISLYQFLKLISMGFTFDDDAQKHQVEMLRSFIGAQVQQSIRTDAASVQRYGPFDNAIIDVFLEKDEKRKLINGMQIYLVVAELQNDSSYTFMNGEKVEISAGTLVPQIRIAHFLNVDKDGNHLNILNPFVIRIGSISNLPNSSEYASIKGADSSVHRCTANVFVRYPPHTFFEYTPARENEFIANRALATANPYRIGGKMGSGLIKSKLSDPTLVKGHIEKRGARNSSAV